MHIHTTTCNNFHKKKTINRSSESECSECSTAATDTDGCVTTDEFNNDTKRETTNETANESTEKNKSTKKNESTNETTSVTIPTLSSATLLPATLTILPDELPEQHPVIGGVCNEDVAVYSMDEYRTAGNFSYTNATDGSMCIALMKDQVLQFNHIYTQNYTEFQQVNHEMNQKAKEQKNEKNFVSRILFTDFLVDHNGPYYGDTLFINIEAIHSFQVTYRFVFLTTK